MQTFKCLFALAACSVLFSIIHCDGQKYYLDAGAGYGLNLASQSIADNYTVTTRFTTSPDGWSSTGNHEMVKGSYGNGLMYGVTLGCMFSEHLSGEIGVSNLSGASIKAYFTDTEYEDYGSGVTSYFTDTRAYTYKGKMLRIIPALKMTMGNGKKMMPYLKAGVVIGLSPSLERTENSKNSFTGNVSGGFYSTYTADTTTVMTASYSGGTSLGFMAALGAVFKLGNVISIYGEVGMIGQTWAPEHGEVTEYTKNGKDFLGTMTTLDREVEYGDNYTYSSSSTASPNTGVPTQHLKAYLPFSSWGLNVGVHAAFGPLLK